MKPLDLRALQRDLRIRLVELHHRTRTSHLGSGLSVMDILIVLYHRVMNVTPHNLDDDDRDILILSKGHAAPALYLVLASKGIVSWKQVENYGTMGTQITEHPVRRAVPGIEASTGSLGHGLSIGVGMAMGRRLRDSNSRVFVIMSDGECQEGAVWEAAMEASRLRLNNLVAVVDWNGLQGYGCTDEIQSSNAVEERFLASGWHVLHVDGHDLAALERELSTVPTSSNRPSVIIAKTTKGRGVPEIEGRLEWHYKSPSDQEAERFIRAIAGVYAEP